MPTDLIKKLASEGKGSVAELEKKWDKAKDSASKSGKGTNYAYITHVFKNMVASAAQDSVKLEAASLEESLIRWKQFHADTLKRFKEMMALSDVAIDNARKELLKEEKRPWLNLSNRWATMAIPLKDILRQEVDHINQLILTIRDKNKQAGRVKASVHELYDTENLGL